MDNITALESVETAFELLQAELGNSVESTRNTAANAVKTGEYEEGKTLVDQARNIEEILTELSDLHDRWDENHCQLTEGHHPHSPKLEVVDSVFGHSEDRKVTDSTYGGPALVMTYNISSARGMYNNRQVVVLAGSKIMVSTFQSLQVQYLGLRNKLLGQGKLTNNGDGTMTLSENVLFNSPSGAAKFIAGCSVSGNRDWRIEETEETLGTWLKADR